MALVICFLKIVKVSLLSVWTDIAFSAALDSKTWCGDFGIPVVDLTSGHLRYCDVHNCPAGSHCYRQPGDMLPALCCRRSTWHFTLLYF